MDPWHAVLCCERLSPAAVTSGDGDELSFVDVASRLDDRGGGDTSCAERSETHEIHRADCTVAARGRQAFEIRTTSAGSGGTSSRLPRRWTRDAVVRARRASNRQGCAWHHRSRATATG